MLRATGYIYTHIMNVTPTGMVHIKNASSWWISSHFLRKFHLFANEPFGWCLPNTNFEFGTSLHWTKLRYSGRKRQRAINIYGILKLPHSPRSPFEDPEVRVDVDCDSCSMVMRSRDSRIIYILVYNAELSTAEWTAFTAALQQLMSSALWRAVLWWGSPL